MTVYDPFPNLHKLSVDPFEIVDQGYLQHEVNASPAHAYGNIYLGDDTGHTFYQFDASDLAQGWTHYFDATQGYQPRYFYASAALTNTGSAGGVVYVGNDNGLFYARSASDVSQSKAISDTLGLVRSSPAIAYIADGNGHLDRWVFVTTRGSGGRLLAFKTGRN